MPVIARPEPRAATRFDAVAVGVAALIGLTVIWVFRFRGWYPHDEGTLGQSAERILLGQTPHRDFVDPYTGGLAYLHALVFRLGGVSTTALRNHFALVATVWFAGIFWWLTRWLQPVGAALAAALIVVWTVPLYPAAMPSWYLVFLTCAAGAILVTSPHRAMRAAYLAGFVVGVAALAKITAIFALAGAAWAVVAIRQEDEDRQHAAGEVVVAAVVFTLLLIRLTSSLLDANVAAHLVVPPVAVALGIAWREVRYGRRVGFGVDLDLWCRVGALVVGAGVPVGIFAIWLARHDALLPFLANLHAVVGRRAASAALAPPSAGSTLYAVPLLAVFLGAAVRVRSGVMSAVVGVAGVTLGVWGWLSPDVHAHIWEGFRGLIPAGALLFAVLWPRGLVSGDPVARRPLIVFVPLTAMMALSQYPFAATIYFVYVIPLLVVALAGAVALRPAETRAPIAVLGGLLVLFALVEVIPGAGENTGMTAWREPLAWLDLRRSHLLVPVDEAERYRVLITTIDSLPPGPIWAGPDAPEVAFLAGRIDLNRSYFGFLDDSGQDRPDFASRLAARGARIVVIDMAPPFSRPLSGAARDSVTRYFPRTSSVDYFEIHWRGVAP
jgi:hypothetical protein